jgi:protein O-GlcNAc transferase
MRGHPVGRLLLPLLEAHNHKDFEIFCYSSVQVADALTGRCRAQADVWRDVYGASDEEVAKLIRQDRIHILVDLTMHMPKSRLLVFARKPAPVQVTYLAYPGTTGLAAMDYRLTDPYIDPPGSDNAWYSEQSFYLPETYWCYDPIIATASQLPPPVLQKGFITFGCLNNFCKVNAAVLETWCILLQEIPNARLLLSTDAGNHRDRLRELVSQRGIASDRILFVGSVPLDDYFRIYERIDIALDPFPYGGGTTTCDALWMGVPVVTLAGKKAVGRGGVSILTNIGLTELVAQNETEYVRIAAALANNLPRLSQLRATMRERMRNSPLMDAPRFARNVEAVYRTMWREWCAKHASNGAG